MPRGRPKSGSAALAGVVQNLQSAHRSLLADRVTLDARIKALESALVAMNAGPSAGGVRRGGGNAGFRKGSLKEYIHRVMSGGGAMAVKDVTDGVMKAGFKTKNKTLAKSVGIALTQMPMVSKLGRGMFQMN